MLPGDQGTAGGSWQPREMLEWTHVVLRRGRALAMHGDGSRGAGTWSSQAETLQMRRAACEPSQITKLLSSLGEKVQNSVLMLP